MATAQPKQPGISNAAVNYSSTSPKNNRPPANSSDTRRRKRQLPMAYNSNSQQVTHPDISTEFSDRYSGGIPTAPVGVVDDPTTRRTNGVRNPAVGYRTPPKATNTNQTPQTTNAKSTPKTTTRSNYNTGLRPSPQPRKRRKKRGLKRTIVTAYNMAARISLVMLYAWVGFLWIPQAIFAILFWIALGAQTTIEAYTQEGIMGSIVEFSLQFSGLDWAFDLLFWLAFVINVFLALVQTVSIIIYTKFLGMHPLGGRGFALKTPVAFFAIFFSMIGVGFIPLFWLWVFTISLYPR